jgi:hypothetical protein
MYIWLVGHEPYLKFIKIGVGMQVKYRYTNTYNIVFKGIN